MKKSWKGTIPAFLVLVGVPLTVHADSPRGQLQGMVQQLQQTPGNNALREKIIALELTLDPPPAIAEEARRPFVEGTTFAKSAKDPAQQKLAVDSFKEALKIAPWWGDAYYNLAVAEELAGELDEAQASLKLYILTEPEEKDARDAQDRIYALDAKKKIAQQNSADDAARDQASRNVFVKKMEGSWGGINELWFSVAHYDDGGNMAIAAHYPLNPDRSLTISEIARGFGGDKLLFTTYDGDMTEQWRLALDNSGRLTGTRTVSNGGAGTTFNVTFVRQ